MIYIFGTMTDYKSCVIFPSEASKFLIKFFKSLLKFIAELEWKVKFHMAKNKVKVAILRDKQTDCCPEGFY